MAESLGMPAFSMLRRRLAFGTIARVRTIGLVVNGGRNNLHCQQGRGLRQFRSRSARRQQRCERPCRLCRSGPAQSAPFTQIVAPHGRIRPLQGRLHHRRQAIRIPAATRPRVCHDPDSGRHLQSRQHRLLHSRPHLPLGNLLLRVSGARRRSSRRWRCPQVLSARPQLHHRAVLAIADHGPPFSPIPSCALHLETSGSPPSRSHAFSHLRRSSVSHGFDNAVADRSQRQPGGFSRQFRLPQRLSAIVLCVCQLFRPDRGSAEPVRYPALPDACRLLSGKTPCALQIARTLCGHRAECSRDHAAIADRSPYPLRSDSGFDNSLGQAGSAILLSVAGWRPACFFCVTHSSARYVRRSMPSPDVHAGTQPPAPASISDTVVSAAAEP